ncbi:unnamed protein product [Symbiodinium microadriaticum]|nr:unnamed protein product [Symbiodinium microadriaticum]
MGECDDGPTPPDQREGLVHEYLGQGFTAGGNSIDEPLSVQLDKQSTDSSYDNDTLTAQPQSLDEADSMIPHIGFDHMPLCGQSALDEEPLRKKLRTDSVGGVYPLDAVETKPRDNTVVERDEEGEDDWGERQQTRISTKHVSDNLTEMNSTQQIGATIFRTFKSFAADISIWRSSHTPEEPSDVIRLADKRMSGQCAPSSSAPKPISSSTLPSSLQDSNTVVDLTE